MFLVQILTFFLSWQYDRYGSGQWSQDSRNSYNLVDALTRHTAQVNQLSHGCFHMTQLQYQVLLSIPLCSDKSSKKKDPSNDFIIHLL